MIIIKQLKKKSLPTRRIKFCRDGRSPIELMRLNISYKWLGVF